MSLLFKTLQRLDGDRDVIASFPSLEAIEFVRCAERRFASKSDSALTAPDDEGLRLTVESEPRPRAVEWPQPASNSSPAGLPGPLSDQQELSTASAGAALAGSAESPLKLSSGVKRAVAALRAALPFVQVILPLLDGSTSATASTAHRQASPVSRPQPPADLDYLESGLSELKTEHRELCDRIVEQNSSLKRMGDHLERVREATDRNTREQQELIEELKGVSNKITFVAMVAFALLGVTVVIDVVVYLHVF